MHRSLAIIPPQRRAAIVRLIRELVTCAERQGDERWGLTPYPTGVRLNVGWTELVTAYRDHVRLIVDGKLARKAAALEGVKLHAGSDARGFYASVPGSCLVELKYDPSARFGRLVRALEPAMHKAVRLAAARRIGRGVREGHSEPFAQELLGLAGMRVMGTGKASRDVGRGQTTAAPVLHIVQGGVDNGDKRWLERAAKRGLSAPSWVIPKCAKSGDEVVIYVAGYGFFATATVTSSTAPRKDWTNRYGASLNSIKLIKPPISLENIQSQVPQLKWATYPRSVVTLGDRVADRVRALVAERRRTGVPILTKQSLNLASLEELRAMALYASRLKLSGKRGETVRYIGAEAVRRYVLRRAGGKCEGCGCDAPFVRPSGESYLEAHHTRRRADGGPDHPAHVIGLCPTCHRRAHHASDQQAFNGRLKRRVYELDRRSSRK